MHKIKVKLVHICFHSISFPSEWGLVKEDVSGRSIVYGFHSISFPSEWGQSLGYTECTTLPVRFHSISFPSEWGLEYNDCDKTLEIFVSIQLVSPASGDT